MQMEVEYQNQYENLQDRIQNKEDYEISQFFLQQAQEQEKQPSEIEEENDDSSLFSNQQQFKSRFSKQRNENEKIEYISQITLERQKIYIRRENFLQTYSALMKYLDKLFKSEFFSLLPISDQFPQKRKLYLSESVQLISSQLKKVFFSKGLTSGQEIYKYLLERSMNTPLLKLYGKQIFDHQLKKHKKYQKSFETEYSHKKGIINYFDPDFNGSLNLIPQGNKILTLDLKLYCHKSMIYMKVLMTMYKKLLRLVFILEMIFNRLFGKCGRQFYFKVHFGFFYDQLSFKKQELEEMKQNSFFLLGSNKQVQFEYILKENEDYYQVLCKQEYPNQNQINSLQIKVENQGEQIKQENLQD
ncbi:hypothetical protein TTHERM_00494670 (macronuclear) [Tetrahymena thermophila SB210]|uniref:Uncharacterized protein n=1 Tax=Tetrahymena thermophila (strain SB210) TaxID=312017 RepID=I7LWW9_TETTS|nr:hypothetical protein TTHERM_00494670 [Tetrahymena thermophila SB210]EAS03006.3 hypothetical protein TTHERM_00494670 [Tetrahymena thermophila SB210]|eukprot:XP_001023251.3 hypothetical protein TTHERM_00494670 [Tetrahymena thermophila SB210]